MNIIENMTYDEERALYNIRDTEVRNCTFAGEADGESVLKECRDIRVKDCSFSLRYPMWHADGFLLKDSTMDDKARAALWYSRKGKIKNCSLNGVKAVRECSDIRIRDSKIVSPEFGWKSSGIDMKNTEIESEYIFMNAKNVVLKNVKMKGKYSFQYIKGLEITNCELDTKDAFWHSKDIVVRDSVIKGEYLGWFSENLTLINCIITGTQPLCYCKGLVLENCEMHEADLAFEYSDVMAEVVGHIDSVKNPRSGVITADSIGLIVRDDPVMECTGKVIIRGE